MSESYEADDQTKFLALIGHVCLQWALLEHAILAILAASENIPLEKAYAYFSGMDMLPRLGTAIALTEAAKWPKPLQAKLKAIRKALQKDGENLQWRRNQAIHGVHKQSGAPASFSLTMPRERGPQREMDVSVDDLHKLVLRLGELVAEAWDVFDKYGEWKFDPCRQQHVHEPRTDRSSPALNVKQHVKSALKRLFRY